MHVCLVYLIIVILVVSLFLVLDVSNSYNHFCPVYLTQTCKGFCDMLKAHSLLKLDSMQIVICTTLIFPLHMKGLSKHRHLGG
jgi:hypothetical protein